MQIKGKTRSLLRTGFELPKKELLALHTETLFETIYTTTGINQLLLSSKERMTFGTNIKTDVFLG
jgi:hypothetical protein